MFSFNPGPTMADAAAHASVLPSIIVFCAAAVTAVPLARFVGLGPVLGYLVAGVIIGPSALKLVGDAGTIRSVAELGVVMLLFLVGLELKLTRLFELRRDIFGLGSAQLMLTGVVLAGLGRVMGLDWPGAMVLGAAFALSATSIALQSLEERGDLQNAYGQRTFSVLLFQDLSIVPILAAVPLIASAQGGVGNFTMGDSLFSAAKAFAAVLTVVLVGRYLLNPLFRLLANSGAREVMTAAALLVVLGAALLMEVVGMSMAMGAFLAGLMLAESNFRHQLEADIEPFRGVLLGLFFMSVGMSLDLALVARYAWLLVIAAPILVGVKIAVGAGLAMIFGSSQKDAWRIGALLAPAGEFAFVIVPLTAALGLVNAEMGQVAVALAAISMLMGPLLAKGLDAVMKKSVPVQAASDIQEDYEGAGGSVLVIGFGRFGQVVNQVLLAEGHDVTVIDRNVARLKSAASFGFKIYFGDGARLDVLHAAGAAEARVICICVDDKDVALRIVELVHNAFPKARLHVRAYDRIHAIDLMNAGVDLHMRETFESALSFGRSTLQVLGADEMRASDIANDVRRRDIARLVMQQSEGIMGGLDLLHNTAITPQPLTAPKTKSQALTDETRAILDADDKR
jgi:glutathione-regulated potassium-efflux system protein KefB